MKIMKVNIILVIFGFLALMLSSCGGSSGGGSGGNTPNSTPVIVMDSSNGGVANGATNISLIPMIVLKFNEAAQFSTVNSSTVSLSTNAQLKTTQDNLVNGQVAIGQIVSNSTNTLFSFSPAQALAPNTKYYINVNNVITQSGKSITQSFYFTTGASTQVNPTVAVVSPSSGELGVSNYPSIMLQFSANVNNVNKNNITLHKGSVTGDLVNIKDPVAGSNNTYVFSPAAKLESYTKYYIVLNNQITDNNGNNVTNFSSLNFTTGNAANPVVTPLIPSNNSIGITASQIMQIVFSSPVDPSTVNLNTVLLREGSINGTEIKISQFTANADNTVFTITTVSPLKPNTTYYLIFGDGIKTLSGDSINNTAFSFTTADSSIISPSVTIVSPNNNESNVPLNPFIKLQFSESVLNVATNVQIYNTQVGGSVVDFSLSMESNNLFVLNPSVQLNSGTKYYVVVGSGITNSAGSANLESAIYSFTTGDLASPTVSISPSNNTNGVSIFRPQITLQFSNDMESSTINESSVQLWQNGESVAISSITYAGKNIYVFSPLSNLTPGMVYQIVLSGQIADTNNNHLLPVASSFSTANYLFSSSTAGTLNPGKNFILSYTYSDAGSIFESASLTVSLPSGFTANSNDSYTCNFTQNNPTCAQEIHIDANTNIGSHQIQLSTSLGIALDPTYVSVLNDNYTYIVNSVGSGLQIEKCSYNESGITSCSNSGAVINSLPYGISFSPDGKYGYVSVGGNGIYKCVVSAGSGGLSDCAMESSTSSYPANRDTAITSDGRYIYADLLIGNGIYGCSIESGTGSLFNCGDNYVNATQLPNPVERIILNSDDSQLLVNAQGKVVQCSIGSNYQITNCTPQTTNIYGSDTLGLNFNLAYNKVFVAAGLSTSIFQCAYSSVSGVDGNCASAWGTPFAIPGSFRFTDLMFTPYNYVLITNVSGANGGLYKCNVDINGLLDGSSCVKTVSQSTTAEQVTVN